MTGARNHLVGSIGRFRGRGGLALLCAGALLTACMPTSVDDLERFVEQTHQRPPQRDLEPLPEVDAYQPFFYEAEGRKDPFALSRFVIDAMTRREPVVDSDIRPDTDRPTEELENYQISALRFVGTFQDPQTRGLWALIRAPDGIVHRVRIGNYIGQNFGEIYNITPDRIDLLEIVRDPATGAWQERQNTLSLAQ